MRSYRQFQSGVALAMLMWFVAALSLLVAALVAQSRLDVRLTQLHRDQAIAAASGDGAVQLAMDQWYAAKNNAAKQGWMQVGIHFDDRDIQVTIVSLSGLIDVNNAPPELLTKAFAIAGNVPMEQAEVLARRVVNYRKPSLQDDKHQRNRHFDTLEDLLRVPGVGRDLIERLRPVMYGASTGQPGVNIGFAPPEVLAVLGADADQARRLVNARGGDGVNLGGSGFATDFQSTRHMLLYRVDAIVNVNGKQFLRRCWVKMGRSAQGMLPWRIYRREAPRLLSTG